MIYEGTCQWPVTFDGICRVIKSTADFPVGVWIKNFQFHISIVKYFAIVL